jgi:hypothetical protein
VSPDVKACVQSKNWKFKIRTRHQLYDLVDQTIPSRKEFKMRASFGFPSVEVDERQKYSRVPI